MKLNKLIEKSDEYKKFLSSGLYSCNSISGIYLGLTWKINLWFNMKNYWSFECKSGRKTQYSLKFRKYK